MGILNCNIECHYYNKKKTAFFNDLSKREEEITNNIYNNENLINNNNSEILIKIKDLIPKKILDYIKTHKLTYKSKIPLFSSIFLSKATQLENGNIFFGFLKESNIIDDGYGILIIQSKKLITEGYWENSTLKFGRIFFPNEEIYEGNINNFLPNGFGKMIYPNGDIYKGDFKLGELTGYGTYIFSDNTYYCGDIKNGIFNGKGSMKWINGIEYHGMFYDSKLNNKGKMYHDLLKEKYIGNFDNNEFNGTGIYEYQNGDIYNGNFEYGIRKGKGNYKIKNLLLEYFGEWDNDLPNGEGVLTGVNFKIKGKWGDGKFMGLSEILEGDNIDVNNMCLNIDICSRKIIPSSLPHLNKNNETEIILYSIITDINNFI